MQNFVRFTTFKFERKNISETDKVSDKIQTALSKKNFSALNKKILLNSIDDEQSYKRSC